MGFEKVAKAASRGCKSGWGQGLAVTKCLVGLCGRKKAVGAERTDPRGGGGVLSPPSSEFAHSSDGGRGRSQQQQHSASNSKPLPLLISRA